MPSRRSVLATSAALGTGAVGGYSWWRSGPRPAAGDLVISNEGDRKRTVTVTVRKESEDDDDVKRHDRTPDSETTPIWRRTKEFTVTATEVVAEAEFLTETGAFFVEASVDEGGSGSNWVGLYEGTDGVAEDAIFVDILDGDRVTVYGSHSD